MRRACKISLKFLTTRKQRQVGALLQSYRAAVNFYIKSLWTTKGRQDADVLARLRNSRLSQRYRQAALKQAMEMIISSKRSAKEQGIPCGVPCFSVSQGVTGQLPPPSNHLPAGGGGGSHTGTHTHTHRLVSLYNELLLLAFGFDGEAAQ